MQKYKNATAESFLSKSGPCPSWVAQCANYYSKLLIVLITSCCGSLTGENEMLKLVLEKINPMAQTTIFPTPDLKFQFPIHNFNTILRIQILFWFQYFTILTIN